MTQLYTNFELMTIKEKLDMLSLNFPKHKLSYNTLTFLWAYVTKNRCNVLFITLVAHGYGSSNQWQFIFLFQLLRPGWFFKVKKLLVLPGFICIHFNIHLPLNLVDETTRY